MNNSLIINANGWIGFGEGSDAWYNGNIPSVDAPSSAIFGFWDDLNPVNDNCNSTCSGNVYYQSTDDRLVVWFEDVYHWASGDYGDSFYDFQIVIHANGEIGINIRNIEGNYSATVGIQNSTGTIATQVDEYDGDYFQDEVAFEFIAPYQPGNWLSLTSDTSLNGDINDGESVNIDVEVNSTDLMLGDYMAHVLISTNMDSTIDLPVNLTVTDEGLLLGDVNFDSELNVLDVVMIVGYVLGNDELTDIQIQASDLNGDGMVDVLDIVMLVGAILNS